MSRNRYNDFLKFVVIHWIEFEKKTHFKINLFIVRNMTLFITEKSFTFDRNNDKNIELN